MKGLKSLKRFLAVGLALTMAVIAVSGYYLSETGTISNMNAMASLASLATGTDAIQSDDQEKTEEVYGYYTMEIPSSEASVTGVEYGIYNDQNCDNLIDTFVFSHDGKAYVDKDKKSIVYEDGTDIPADAIRHYGYVPAGTYYYKISTPDTEMSTISADYRDESHSFIVSENNKTIDTAERIKLEGRKILATANDAAVQETVTDSPSTEAEQEDASEEDSEDDPTEGVSEEIVTTEEVNTEVNITEEVLDHSDESDQENTATSTDAEDETKISTLMMSTFSLMSGIMKMLNILPGNPVKNWYYDEWLSASKYYEGYGYQSTSASEDSYCARWASYRYFNEIKNLGYCSDISVTDSCGTLISEVNSDSKHWTVVWDGPNTSKEAGLNDLVSKVQDGTVQAGDVIFFYSSSGASGHYDDYNHVAVLGYGKSGYGTGLTVWQSNGSSSNLKAGNVGIDDVAMTDGFSSGGYGFKVFRLKKSLGRIGVEKKGNYSTSSYYNRTAYFDVYTDSACTHHATYNGSNVYLAVTEGSPSAVTGAVLDADTTYYVKERAKSGDVGRGYNVNTTVYKVVPDAEHSTYATLNSSAKANGNSGVTNTAITWSLQLNKSGDYVGGYNTLEGAEFTLYLYESETARNNAIKSGTVNGGTVVGTFRTNNKGEGIVSSVKTVMGVSTTGNGTTKLDKIPLGYYALVETKAPQGYYASYGWKKQEGDTLYKGPVSLSVGQTADLSQEITTLKDAPYLWDLSIVKEGDNAYADSPLYSLNGTQFTVYHYDTAADRDNDLKAGKAEKGTMAAVFTADADGIGTVTETGKIHGKDVTGKGTDTVHLPTGWYIAVETKAPAGYYNSYGWKPQEGDTNYHGPVSYAVSGSSIFDENGRIIHRTLDATDNSINDPAGIMIYKRDKQTGEKVQGGASLAGAEFTIKYYDDFYDSVSDLPKSPTRTWVLKTNENGFCVLKSAYLISSKSDEFYMSKNGNPVIPLGTITIEETKAPTGYTLDNLSFKSVETGDIVSDIKGIYFTQVTNDSSVGSIKGGNEYEVEDYVIRGDLAFKKTDENEKPLANVKFSITNTETKESHVVWTDADGYYSTEASYIKHSKNTNDGKSGSGIWFGGGKADDTLGALPYGTYEIKELRCEANKEIYKNSEPVTVKVNRNAVTVDAGTIIDHDFPSIHTTARDSVTNNHTSSAVVEEVTLIDSVSLTKLDKGHKYTLSTVVMDKATGKKLVVAGGNVTDKTTFTATASDMTVETEVTFSSKGLEGKDVVFFETLTDTAYPGEVIARHEDINDAGQTIHFVDIHTTATAGDEEKEIYSTKNIKLNDVVTFTGLTKGKTYTVKGKLMDKETGKAYLSNGKEVTAETTFTAEKEKGSVTVTFTFDCISVKEKQIVVFEDLYQEDYLLAVHADINDDDQTIKIKPIRGDLEFKKVDENGKPIANVKFSITDKATGESHIVWTDADGYYSTEASYILHTKDTNSDQPGSGIWFGTAKVDDALGALPYGTYMVQELRCEANFEKYKNADPVEIKVSENKQVVTLEDITDHDFPSIHTTARDSVTNNHTSSAVVEEVTLIDSVSLTKLDKGHKYTLSTVVMDKATGKKLVVADGNVTDKTTFTATDATMTVETEVTFSSKGLEGKDVVFFETLTDTAYPGEVIARHEDINDAGQTIHFVDIHTIATAANEEKEIYSTRNIKLNDVVTYTGLTKGKTYTVKGKLMDKETGKAYLSNGKEVTAETTFTAEKEKGSVTITFTFDCISVKEKQIVVFEDLYQEDYLLAVHADINDDDQTIKIKPIRGDLEFKKVDENGKPIANVKFSITDKATEESHIVWTDADGYYSTEASYILHTKDTNSDQPGSGIWFGTAKVDDALGALPYGTYMVQELRCEANFETYKTADPVVVSITKNKQLVTLDDIKDEDFPLIHTTARDSVTNNHTSSAFVDEITLIDTVEMERLDPGHLYTLHTTVMDKETGEILEVEGGEVTAETTFTATADIMSVETEVTFSSKGLEGKDVVFFETLTDTAYPEEVIARHEDINDAGQTIHFVDIHTTATGKEGEKTVYTTKEITLVDVVEFKGLTKGETYTVSGVLMDRETGEKFLSNGKEVTAETTFTAEKEKGSVEVTFTFSGVNLGEKQIVVFENLYQDDYLLAVHADINDDGQTITTNPNPTVIRKKDATTGEEIAGATLSLYDEDGNLVDTWVSTTKPHEVENLAAGVYTLVEEMAPAGYLMSEDVTFEVLADGTVTEVEMYDSYAIVAITKVDIVTGEPLSGAEFTLYDAETDAAVMTAVSNDEGYAEFIKVAPGEYYIKETAFPDGYTVDLSNPDNITYVTVEENQYTNAAPIVLFNQYSRVCIYKVDSETNKPLSGAEFTLYDAETEKAVQTVISDSEGYAEFKDVKPGKYYVKETNAPAGYQISEEKIYIDTSKTNYTMAAPIVMKNTPDTPDTPHTGDSFPILPAAVTAGLSMIGLITVLILKKKRK